MSISGVKQGFLPVVAPTSAVPTLVDRYYDDEEKLLFAVADALAVEYRTIIDAGLYLQVDDAYLRIHVRRNGAAFIISRIIVLGPSAV